MQILTLIIFGIILFAGLTISRRFKDSFFLIAFAIGCACNANYYTSFTHPIEYQGIIFSIDSILFTMFLFTVALKYYGYSLKETQGMIFASVVAIIISALIEFSAFLSYQGYSFEILQTLLKYVFSAIGSLIAIFVMIAYLKNATKRNVAKPLAILNAILLGSIINSTLYYGLIALLTMQRIDNFFSMLIGSYIGKAFASLLAIGSYYINEKLLQPRN